MYAQVNGVNLYYESHGTGQPLILLHGGIGAIEMFGEVLTMLAAGRQVIAVDLQAHGRTADIDRPLSIEAMADDVSALIRHLGFDKVDVMGYSMGGGVALQTAIRHPEQVRKLVAVSCPYKREGWYPEIVAGMSQMGAAAAEPMKQTPMYQLYSQIAPRVEDWLVLLTKMGEMLSRDYDWSEGVAAIKSPTLIVVGDADSVRTSHAVEFFELLGGGKKDGGWDGSGMSNARLAVLPGFTHYTIFSSPVLASTVIPFLDTPSVKVTPPKLEDRAEQPTIGIRTQIPVSSLPSTIPRLIDETGMWLRQHNAVPAGPPFIRYHVINMEGEMDIEIGWPVAAPVSGSGHVSAGVIPAGRYATLIYTDVTKGIEGNRALIEWAKANGIEWDAWDTDHGHAFASRFEFFLSGPADHPDPAHWDTAVAIKLAG